MDFLPGHQYCAGGKKINQPEIVVACASIKITSDEFNLLRSLVYERFGIHLSDEKRALLVGRLQTALPELGFCSFKEYYHYLITDNTNRGINDLINRISTNFSYFYRESTHFDFFSHSAFPELVKRLKEQKNRDIRIWTAGCSTGEEPYMLLMLMMEGLGLDYCNWNAGLLATDISERVLEVANEAVYPMDRISRVPANLRERYFQSAGVGFVAVKDNIRRELTLRRFNLMTRNFPFKKPFQMIFCRNVMIYFDEPTRKALVERFHRSLEPGGYLFIGHSETLGRDQRLYRYIMPACYQKL